MNTPPQTGTPPETVFGPLNWLRQEVLGVPLWEYFAFLLYIILAFYIARLVDYVLQALLRRWAVRTGTQFDDLLLNPLHGPIKVVTFVILLQIGTRVFAWPKWTTAFFSNGLKLVIVRRSHW